MAALRQTLAAAVQRSSTAAHVPTAGREQNVGNVYMHAHNSHPSPMPTMSSPPYTGPAAAPYGAYGQPGMHPGAQPPPAGAQPASGGPQPGHPAQQAAQAPSGADASTALQEKDRELEQLRRDVRKAGEKANFFRSQVITLQQQVSAMGQPVVAASAQVNHERMPQELAKLRMELAEERAEKQSLQLQLQASNGGLDAAAAAELRQRLQEKEQELASAQAKIGNQAMELEAMKREAAAARQMAARGPPATPARNTPSSSYFPPPTAEGKSAPGSGYFPPPTVEGGKSPAAPSSGYFAPASVEGLATPGSGYFAPPSMEATPRNGRSASGSWQQPGTSYSSFAEFAPASVSTPSRPPQLHSHGDAMDPVANPGGHKRALIVGCDYAGKVGTLRAGVADAQQWARFFTKRCGLAEQDIRLLSDDPTQYQQKARPEHFVATRDNILRALQWLVARTSPGDQLFFVFCGHGAQIVAREVGGQRLCENALVPTDVCDEDPCCPRLVSDTQIHQALLHVSEGAQATLLFDCCHAGRPLDRSGTGYLTEYVGRGRVDYEKLRGHPVLPRFLELQQWKAKTTPPEVLPGSIRCKAVHWAACSNSQFCVELPIDDRPRGVFTYIFISALLKAGPQATSGHLLREARQLTADLKGRWRLQQDVSFTASRLADDSSSFLRA